MATATHRNTSDGLVSHTKQLGKANDFLHGRSDAWWKRYHVLSVEWTADEYVFRIDGHETWRTTQNVSDHPEFMLLSMLSSDYELAMLGNNPLPQHSYVDWVQFWQAD